MSERIKNGVIILVAVAWAANQVLSMTIPTYESDPSVNIAFTAVLAFLLAGRDKTPKKGRD